MAEDRAGWIIKVPVYDRLGEQVGVDQYAAAYPDSREALVAVAQQIGEDGADLGQSLSAEQLRMMGVEPGQVKRIV